MSEKTLAAVDDAIRAHIADEEEATVTGWLVTCAYVDADSFENNTTGLRSVLPNGQPFHVSVGLAHVSVMAQKGQM